MLRSVRHINQLVSPVTILMLLLAVMAGKSKATAQTFSRSTDLHFPLAKTAIVAELDSNAIKLDSFQAIVDSCVILNNFYTLNGITVVGAASPEGPATLNQHLSEKRAAAIFDYFSQLATVADSLKNFIYLGSDWTGLRNLAENDSALPYRTEVLKAINSVCDNQENPQTTMQAIRHIGAGKAYSYMLHNYFPKLRVSRLTLDYSLANPPFVPAEEEIVTDTVVESIPDEIPEVVIPSQPVDTGRKFYMGLKTNLLYDALALPSIGAEFYIGRNYSVVANWTYGWWKTDRLHRYWRAYGGDIALRRWFGHQAADKPLTGHHLGIYAGIYTYDFEWGSTGFMGGRPGGTLWDKCQRMAGIEYGYSLPLSRRLNMDFTIGVGYLGGKYVKYRPCDDGRYVWEATRKLSWFGPTKLEISLVWLIGHDNYNRNK